jgi:TonB-linked SusC/RagA family outer membrane protein
VFAALPLENQSFINNQFKKIKSMKKKWFITNHRYLFACAKKILTVMKITVFIIVFASIQTFALNNYAQTKRMDVKIEQSSIVSALEKIEAQSEFSFFYNNKVVKLDKKISVDLKDKTITEILDALFKDTDIEYTITNRQIVLSGKETGSLISQQQKSVSGKVTDSQGASLPGVTVVVKGTTTGVITDINGAYSISNVSANATLQFSFVGMKSQEVVVGGKTTINLKLEEETVGIEEVVAIGYGTMKKANLTGAISTISGDAFENRSVTNAAQALQGQVANLNVVNSDGAPGKKASFNIRGYAGLGASYTPLVIVDGIASNFNDINSSDIETVTVLKDAAASSIYGAQAAYGVILVTTKAGKKNEKPVISYTNNFSFSSPTVLAKTAGSVEFAKLFREADINGGGGGIIDLETINRIEQYYNNPGSIPKSVPKLTTPDRWSDWDDGRTNANEDWSKAMFKSKLSQIHNFSVKGGSELTTYMISLGYTGDKGKLRYYDDYYKRINANIKISTDVTKWLTVGLNVRYANEKTVIPSYWGNPGGGVNSLIGWISQIWPTIPVLDDNGHFSAAGRMAFIAQSNPNTTNEGNLLGTGTALFKILPGLTFNMDYTYNSYVMKQTYSKGLLYSWSVKNEPFLQSGSSPENTQVWQNSKNDDYTTGNAYATYDKKVSEHSFKIMAGAQQEYKKTFGLYASKMGLIIPTQPSISTATGILTASDAMDHWTTRSFFGRFNYNYREKYLFEFNLRRDGSSRYPDKSIAPGANKWGTFPSFSAGWNIAKESFFSSFTNYFSELKLRGSWGELGNMRGKSYQYISTISYNAAYPYIMDNKLIGAFGTPSLISYNTWERNRTLDLGLDISSFNNRLSGSFDWYQRDIIDLITKGVAVPAVLGAISPETNNADIRNVGWEFSLSWKDRFKLSGKPLSYNAYINVSDYKGSVTKYSNPNGLLNDWYVGKSMGEIWGYTTEHIMIDAAEAAKVNASGYQKKFGSNWTQGDMMYKDLDNSGFINNGSNTLNDHGDLSVIGNNTPRYNYGAGLNLEWNGFDINVFFQGVGKRELWTQGVLTNGLGGGQWGSNVWKNTLDTWRNDGSNLDPFWPKFYLNSTSKNLQVQSKYLQDASYCRLKNLQIGYTLPSKTTKRISIEKVRIYLSGENLFTFSKINENLDPEVPVDGVWGDGVYPLSKSVSAGINITL